MAATNALLPASTSCPAAAGVCVPTCSAAAYVDEIELPASDRDDPDVQFLTEEARVKVATVVQLKYQATGYETAGKTFEFSRAAMEEHWQAGYDDTRRALDEPGVFELPHVSEAARIFDVHRGWMK